MSIFSKSLQKRNINRTFYVGQLWVNGESDPDCEVISNLPVEDEEVLMLALKKYGSKMPEFTVRTGYFTASIHFKDFIEIAYRSDIAWDNEEDEESQKE